MESFEQRVTDAINALEFLFIEGNQKGNDAYAIVFKAVKHLLDKTSFQSEMSKRGEISDAIDQVLLATGIEKDGLQDTRFMQFILKVLYSANQTDQIAFDRLFNQTAAAVCIAAEKAYSTKPNEIALFIDEAIDKAIKTKNSKQPSPITAPPARQQSCPSIDPDLAEFLASFGLRPTKSTENTIPPKSPE